jgi:hypothetical protein
MSGADELKWARRVRQDVIRRLYTLDAKGIQDEELVNEVGYAMYARCESVRTVTYAHAGRAACPRCGTNVEHVWIKTQPLVCTCGWETTWGEYLRSYQGKQLHGGTGFPAFLAFLEAWPKARSYRDKLLAIDRLIHACHGAGTKWEMSRPLGVNLIEGNAHEIAALLDELAYGDGSTPGLPERRDEWRALAERSGWRKL